MKVNQCCHLQVPEFLWKCIEKIESKPSYLATEGIYRVPGDASKIQKVRIDIDQVIVEHTAIRTSNVGSNSAGEMGIF